MSFFFSLAVTTHTRHCHIQLVDAMSKFAMVQMITNSSDDGTGVQDCGNSLHVQAEGKFKQSKITETFNLSSVLNDLLGKGYKIVKLPGTDMGQHERDRSSYNGNSTCSGNTEYYTVCCTYTLLKSARGEETAFGFGD